MCPFEIIAIIFSFSFLNGVTSLDISQHRYFDVEKQFEETNLARLSLTGKFFDDHACDRQLQLFREALKARELWALRMFDSWGKLNSGFLQGNRFSFGQFSECVSFQHEIPGDNEAFSGQYCLVGFIGMPSSITPDNQQQNELGFDWRELAVIARNATSQLINGICVPSTCSHQKVIEFTNSFLNQADLVAVKTYCHPTKTPDIEIIDIIAISLFGTVVCIMTVSTIYDLVMTHKAVEPNKLLISFSVLTNGRNLFDITPPESPNSINCLFGIRALSVLWIIFGHRVGSQSGFPTTNSNLIQKYGENYFSVFYTSYNLAVDTFFLMGALLMTIPTLSALNKKKLNIPRMILRRYLRYTPVLAVIVLYMLSLYKFTLNGPIIVEEFKMSCQNYWWAALLHVQNYVNPNEVCIGVAWYLSADFHLYVTSPLLIYLIFKYAWKGLYVLVGLIIASSTYMLVVCFMMDLRVRETGTERDDLFGRWIYMPTHARIGPWIVGMLLGYILFIKRSKKITLSCPLDIFLWISSLSVLATVMLLAKPLNDIELETSSIFNALYISFHRLVWAIGIAWIIFACQKLKSGGIIREFLSLPHWQPIGRMSLSMYLVHVIYQLTFLQNQKDVMTFELWPLFHNYWGDIVATMSLATFLYLAFEAPILLIENYIYVSLNRKQADS